MKFLKKYKYYFLSFLIPIFVYLIFYWCIGIYFNNKYIPSDAYAQYAPTFKYLYNVLHGNSTFPYTLTKGVGGTMYGAFFYGLSSPLNLFVYFFEDVYLFIFILSILKVSLCGLTSFIYLRRISEHNDFTILLFSLLYSFMGYNLVYGFNIMWFDSVFLAPILLLTIDNYVKKDKHIGYILLLLYILISNYYTGYIMVVFSVIYYIYKLYITYDKDRFIKNSYKNILKFLSVTFLVGCMTMFILIPVALESLNYIRIDSSFHLINFNVFDLFAGTYIGMGNVVNPLNDNTILTYFSLISLPLIINYFYSNEISKKEKKACVLVLLCFFLPVIIPIINRLWHLFTIPQLFNYRYSYLLTLFLIIICLKSYEKINCSKNIYIIFFTIFSILSISLAYNVVKVPDYYMYLTKEKIIISLIIIFIYIFLLLKNKKNLVNFLIIIEIIINLAFIGIDSKTLIKTVINKYVTMDNSILQQKCDANTRCEHLGNKENMNMYNNYNGVSIFLSSVNEKSLYFLTNISNLDSLLGNLFTYKYDDILFDNLMGIKYIDSEVPISYYRQIDYDEKRNRYIYENEYAFSLGFSVDQNIKNYNNDNFGIYFFEGLFNSMFSDNESYIKEVKYTKVDDTKYIAHLEEDIPYLFIETDKPTTNIDQNLAIKDDYGVYYNVKKGDIELEFEDKLNKIKLYYLDLEKLSNLKKEMINLNIIENNGNYIKGDIDLEKDQTLFTTIPYELGWKVYVDEILVKNYEVIDTFLAIDVPKGSHTIEFKYYVPGLEIGIIISLFSSTILIIYELKRRK